MATLHSSQKRNPVYHLSKYTWRDDFAQSTLRISFWRNSPGSAKGTKLLRCCYCRGFRCRRRFIRDRHTRLLRRLAEQEGEKFNFIRWWNSRLRARVQQTAREYRRTSLPKIEFAKIGFKKNIGIYVSCGSQSTRGDGRQWRRRRVFPWLHLLKSRSVLSIYWIWTVWWRCKASSFLAHASDFPRLKVH